MQLRSLTYAEYEDQPGEWTLRDLTLRDQNLLVGVNASGKTRTLSLIWNLARVVAGDLKPTFHSTRWEAHFDHDGQKVTYRLTVQQAKVVQEEFIVGENVRLSRGVGGRGKIWAEQVGKMMDFQSPESEVAVVTRRDSIQHTFLEMLHQWGHDVYFFSFGGELGKHNLALVVKDVKVPDLDPRDTSKTSVIYRKGEFRFGDVFKNAIKQDMERMRYPIDEIGQETLPLLFTDGELPLGGAPLTTYVKEHELTTNTDQLKMSSGMWCALALLIQLNYAQLAAKPSCIVIDDIGEGLDFERSCLLIGIVREKALAASVQLVMSTNDRFVMNHVPLEDWSVLRRTGGLVHVHNYENSKSVFDEFKITGLSNFDFFAMDFVESAQGQTND